VAVATITANNPLAARIFAQIGIGLIKRVMTIWFKFWPQTTERFTASCEISFRNK